MTEVRKAHLGVDTHSFPADPSLFVPEPPVPGGVRQEASAVSAFGQLTAKVAELETAVQAVQEAQAAAVEGGGEGATGFEPGPEIPALGG